MELRNDKGQIVRLLNTLGRPGGEGQLYLIENSPTMVAKVYHQPAEVLKATKLRYQVQVSSPALQSIAAWPTELLLDPNNRNFLRGIVMPRLAGKEIHKLYGPADRAAEYPSAGWDFLIHAAMNCAAAFETLHENGVLMADVNEGNLLVNERTGQIGLIDCDSYQIKNGSGVFLCDVGIPMWTPPELQGLNFRGLQRTPNHDRFGLAVLIFRLLYMGRHPFAGIPTGPDQYEIEEAIKKFLFAFSKQTWSRGVKPPPYSLSLGAIPERLGRLFERAFLPGSVSPNARPTGREWASELKSLLVALKKGCIDPGHKFWNGLTACPWCEIANSGGPNFFISVSVHFGSANLMVDFSTFWATIDRIAHGTLMREQIILPAIGRATSRPMPLAMPQAPNLTAPVMPVKPPLPVRVVLPAPVLPERPVMKPPAPIIRIPLGSNERIARLCGLGVFFFGAFTVLGYQMEVVAAMYGAVWAMIMCLIITAVKTSRARHERAIRIQTENKSRAVEKRRVEEAYTQCIMKFDAQTAELTNRHAQALARVEAEYQNAWLKLDQVYQVEYSAYLTARRQFDEVQRKYQEKVEQWNDECQLRRDRESQLRQGLNALVDGLRNSLSSYQAQVPGKIPALEAARKRFEQSKLDEIADMRKLHQKRQELQLHQYLKNQTIQNADIPNIGSGRKSALTAYGIGSAWDIQSSINVPGFGSSLVGNLLLWRQACERQFRYNPNSPLPPAEVNSVKIKHAQARQTALAEIRGGAAKLDALEIKMRAVVSRGKVEILEMARAQVQAIADLEACS